MTPRNYELAEVIERCKRGDGEAFSQLVDVYARRCYGYFYRLTGNRATSDDLLSELFVRVVERISSFRSENFDGWLFKVARNVFYDYLRDRQRREKMVEYRRGQLESEQYMAKGYDSDKADRLQSELGKLGEDVREAIVLRYYSQLSFEEIAKMRGEPIGTTLSKVHRGLKRLRELMEQ